jgi:glycerol-3-phosphate O-acyltransferase/dihydroxyacetone phosphate acyltransferase
MVYRIIRWLTSITLKAYFRKVDVRGTENIPARGPVIFVANHPSAFMDPMLIGTYARRSLHFIAAAEFMGHGLKSWIYRKQLHMIPVYRPSTLPGETARNKNMFSQCYELLARGGAVVIFPEGNSVTENRIRKLKTGAARMALGARDHSADGVEVSIVPVGLNYANPHRFQSEVFVNIGEPITTKGWTSDQEGAAGLTAEIESRLKKAVIHVEHEELDSLVKKVELIMKSRPGKQRMNQDGTSDESFVARQQIIDSMHTTHESQPETIRQIEMRLDAYLNKIRQMGISDSSVATLSPFNTPLERARLIAGRPLFIAGFLINAIPYYITVFIFRRLKLLQPGRASKKQDLNPAFRGSVAIAVGMVVFSNWYIGWALVCAILTGIWWVAFAALLVFYLTGLFTLRYIGWTMISGQKSKVRKLLGKDTSLYSELIVERREIFESIKKLTQEFQTK